MKRGSLRPASLFATGRARGTKIERRQTGLRWIVDAALPLSLSFVVAALAFAADGLEPEGRWVLFACGEATVLWSTTRIDPAYIGLFGAFFLVVVGAVPAERLHDSLASDVVWLMIGAFVVAGALRDTGVATRATRLLLARARTVGHAIYWITAAIVPLALIVPSTSARAAIVLPVFHDLAEALRDRRARRAFGLLIPSVILVSTIGSLVAAGSHLIAEQLLEQSTGQRIGYLQWLLWGAPFALVASAATAFAIDRAFLPSELRRRPLSLPAPSEGRIDGAGYRAIAVVVTMIALWVTGASHGVDIATVTVGGALLLTLPRVGVISFGRGLKAVSWNLVVFVGAALVLGNALIDSGAGTWVLTSLLASGSPSGSGALVLTMVLALVTVTSHIYIPSHAARAAAFVPPLLYFATAVELDPLAIVFFANVGLDYCLTFPISSKALLLYQQLDRETFEAPDLLRLSAILLPAHVLLMVLFYFAYWQWVGAGF